MKNIYKLIGIGICMIAMLWSCSEDGLTESGLGTVTGTVVTDGDNTPLANVKITSNPSSNTVFTVDNGNFIIPEILVGEYSFQAELDGYTTQFKPVTVIDDVETNVVFELVLANSNNEAPLAPVLVFPADGSEDVATTNINFIWNSSANDEDIIEYTFELRNGTTNEMLVAENLVDTTYLVPSLALGTTYFWQVTAKDEINEPVQSSLSSFSTIDGSENRFFYVRKVGGNNVIFSGDDSNETGSDEPNENEIQITSSDKNSFRPRKDPVSKKVAFLRTVGADTQLFVMNFDGTDEVQITDVNPVNGFRQDEIDFTWYNNGNRILYPSLNRLHSVNPFGTGNTVVYEAPAGVFITEVDSNEANGLVAIKTNDAAGYNARISIINPNTGIESLVVLDNVNGAVGGIDYSIDASKVLYTLDVSGFEIADYQILDSRIFEYVIATDTATEIDTQKPVGTNNLDAKYSPDEGAIIYVNTSADGISQRDILKYVFGGTTENEVLFTDAFMPDWK